MGDARATNIREIAALAGVSAGTVSRVMNRKPGVGDATRQRVAALIEEHGFRGDSVARQLSTGRSSCLGIVFPLQVSEVIMHPVYPELLGAISDAAQEAGYDVMLFTTKATASVEHIIDAVRRKRVDGLVLPAASSRDLMIGSVLERHIPTVLVGHRQRGERLTWVDCDHDSALYELTRRQLDAGRRRLTLVNGPRWVSAYRLRSEGFWRAVEEAGPEVVGQEVESEMGYADGLRVAHDILAADAVPDAILCSSDTTAAGVLESLSEAGIRCPDDVAVAGFDDIEFAQHSAPTLTTVRMPLHDTGVAAVELLIEMISDAALTPEPRVLASQLIPRESDR